MAMTGLILAGGQGARMEHRDKGLQPLAGQALVERVQKRLQPQVDAVLISANRNLDAYQNLGLLVLPDDVATVGSFSGPLAGLHAGLTHCTTPLLACVPCDAPFLPIDLVSRLHTALARTDSDIAIAISGIGANKYAHPVFCLLKTALLPHLTAYIRNGGRKVSAWQAQHKLVEVQFDDENAFRNINSLDDLRACEAISHE